MGGCMWQVLKKCIKFSTLTAIVYTAFIYSLFLISYKNKEVDSVARVICRPMTALYEQIRDVMVRAEIIPTRDDYITYLLFLPAWVFLFGFVLAFLLSVVYQVVRVAMTKVKEKLATEASV